MFYKTKIWVTLKPAISGKMCKLCVVWNTNSRVTEMVGISFQMQKTVYDFQKYTVLNAQENISMQVYWSSKMTSLLYDLQ